MTRYLIRLTLASAAFAAAPSVAAEPLQTVQVVATADLDLSTRDGRETLDRRLVRAAIDVCGAASASDLEGRNAVRECRVTTLAKARAAGDARIAKLDRREIRIAAR